MPKIMRTRDLAAELGISPRRLNQLAEEGVAVRVARGRFDATATIKAVKAATGKRAARSAEKMAREAQRERLAKERADALAMTNAQKRSALVSADEVEKRWDKIARRIRSKLLAVPARLEKNMPHLTPKDVAAIDAELRRVLTELAGPADT